MWSTLLDPRDWPSYLYVFAALVLFVYLPLQVYKLYEKAQIQATVIDAIASGDPDFRQILDLLDKDPTSDWATIEIGEKSEPTELDYSGLEILTHSRMLDLRKWNPDEASPDRQGRVLLRDRVTLKLSRFKVEPASRYISECSSDRGCRIPSTERTTSGGCQQDRKTPGGL